MTIPINLNYEIDDTSIDNSAGIQAGGDPAKLADSESIHDAIAGMITSSGAALPSQTGNSGKFLSTDGTSPSWQTASGGSSLPSQTGNSGKVLRTDGTNPSWSAETVEVASQTGNSGKVLSTNGTSTNWITSPNDVASQTSNSGKYLTTNGSVTSWDTPSGTLPSQTGNSGKFLSTDGTNSSWATVSSGGKFNISVPEVQVAQSLTRYVGFGVSAASSSESDVQWPMANSGSFNGFSIKTLANVGGSSQSATYTVRKNGTDQALTCTISSGASTATDSAHSFSYVAGDLISIKIVTTSTSGTVTSHIMLGGT